MHWKHFFQGEKCQLQANSKRAGNLKEIPGYPISLEGTSDYKLFIDGAKNSNQIFWIEDNNKLKSMNVSSFAITEKKFDSEKINICVAKKEFSSGGILWVTTSEGNVYLLNKNYILSKGLKEGFYYGII